MKRLIIGFLIILLIGATFAAPVENILHLNVKSTYSNGDVQTGTFKFTFNISNSSDCANVVYTNYTNLTTDNSGIVSYYLENLNLDYSVQYWLCIYKDGVLTFQEKMARVPYAFYSNDSSHLGGQNASYYLNSSGVGDYFTRGINATFENITAKNVSLSGKLFFISNFIDNLISGVIRIFADLRVEGALNVSGMAYYNNATPITALNETNFISGVANASLNQLLNLTILQYLNSGTNASYLSTYNITYHGLIQNASYLSTYNVTYEGLIQNASYLSTYNATYHGYPTNWNSSIQQYLNSGTNTSYLSTYNATYHSFTTNVSTNWTQVVFNTYNGSWANDKNATGGDGNGSYINVALTNQTNNFVGFQNISGGLNVSGNLSVKGNYICNASACFSFADLNLTGSGTADGNGSYINVALTNQSNTFTGNQTISGNLSVNGGYICNETSCYSLADLNTTGTGTADGNGSYVNVALTNQSQTLIGNQTIVGNVSLSGVAYWFVGLFNIFESAFGIGSSTGEILFNGSTIAFNQSYNNVTIGFISNTSINQLLNLTILQYLNSGTNTSYLSTYNATYHGYPTNWNSSILQYLNTGTNTSYLTTYNSTYHGYPTNWNSSILQYLNTGTNASYLSTYNATYHSYATNVSTNWTQVVFNTYNGSWANDKNITGTGDGNGSYINVALTNQSNTFTGNQTISGNLSVNGGYICNTTSCYSLADLNLTIAGGSWPGYVNIALTNQTNNFVGFQNISGGLNISGNLSVKGNYICNASACFSLQDLNLTGSGTGDGNGSYVNVMLTNQTTNLNTTQLTYSNSLLTILESWLYSFLENVGLIQNASYLSTYNATYHGYPTNWNSSILQYLNTGTNTSYLTTYNLTYHGYPTNWNSSINQYFAGANTTYPIQWNSSILQYLNTGTNTSYLMTYNASYQSFNTTANIQWLYNFSSGTIANLSLNQLLNATILAYLNSGTNTSYLDRSNLSYQSFNTTANIQWLYNFSSGTIANISLNQLLNLTILQYLNSGTNTSYLTTYNITYHGLIQNASYLSTYNASYESFNSTGNIQRLINNTNALFGNITFTSGGYIYDNGTTLILGHT